MDICLAYFFCTKLPSDQVDLSYVEFMVPQMCLFAYVAVRSSHTLIHHGREYHDKFRLLMISLNCFF